MNVFQGEGVVKFELFYSFLNGVGVNPGRQTMYHMCKTWLKKGTRWVGIGG